METEALLSDEQIMQEVRAGNVGRLEALFDRHHRALFRYFLHLTANRAASEDLVQEVFFRILKYRHTYQSEPSFRAWMYQIGRNVFMDQAGRHKAEVAMPENAGEFSGQDALPDRQFQTKEETALLHRALAALPREKREVLVMSRFLDLKYEEIASVLKCEVGTVKVRVYRALRELGDRFFALGGERAI
jgi:RNA polymerase sigma factor (sigma-70 family)